jgi:GNAT superfamily N-acetyltransferase
MSTKQISVRSAILTDEQFVYDVKKEALGPYIAAVWGWDEETQRRFHTEEYQRENSYIVLEMDRPIGWFAFHEEEDVIIVDHLYLLPQSQGKGIGKHLLATIIEAADTKKYRVQLGVLKVNPARRLYERCGFTIVDENDHFYHMERQPSLA